MCLVLDENISPTLVPRLWAQGIDTIHIRDRGLLSSPDHVIWALAIEEKRAVVTINGRDFFKLAQRSPLHYGVVVIPSGGLRDEMFANVVSAIDWVRADRIGPISFLQQFVTVGTNQNITTLTVAADIPPGGGLRGTTGSFLV